MLLPIEQVLTSDELAAINRAFDTAVFTDGGVTAGHQAGQVKRNLQLPEEAAVTRELTEHVMRALRRHPMFLSAALPLAISPILFNEYQPGMVFGNHVDNAIRGTPPLRTDLSCTLFLRPPETYDGGELVIEEPPYSRAIKLQAGDLALYPSGAVHRVQPVTGGVRRVAVFWVQSLVRGAAKRALLFDLDQSIMQLSARVSPQAEEVIMLSACYHNLLRMWSHV